MAGPAPAGGERHPTRWAALVTGAAIVALIALLAFAGGDDATSSSRLIGERVPEIETTTLDGDSYDVDASRGRWVVVNFFATWCPPCVAEHPELVALERWGLDNQRLDVVSVVFDDSPESVAVFFAERGGSWPVVADPGLAVDFQIRRVPESFLVAPSGLVVEHYTGGVTAAAIVRTIEEFEGS